MKVFIFIAVFLAVLTSPVAKYRYNGTMALPDLTTTPGAVDQEIVADTSGTQHIIDGIEKNICAKDFRAKAIRATIKNFAGLKKKACVEYGIDKCDASVEGDHLISIELGGCKNCLTNIWPQPMDQAKIKDHKIEDVLPDLVCSGKITLPEAQSCVSQDWVACQTKIDGLK